MIVKMKKVYLVVQKQEAAEAAHRLRGLGVLHLEHEKPPTSEYLMELKNQYQRSERAVMVLSRYTMARGEKPLQEEAIEDWPQRIQEIHSLNETVEQLKESLSKRQGIISEWSSWGHFNPADVKGLGERGVYIQFYEIPKNELFKIPTNVILCPISSKGNILHCLTVSRSRVELPFMKLNVPLMSLNEMEQRQREDQNKIAEAQLRLQQLASHQYELERLLKSYEDEVRLKEALEGMGESQELAYFKGFCPVDECINLQQTAREEKWGILIADPSSEDPIPTLLRNPKWVEVVKPIFSLMNIIPGYKELDISLIFLFFFSLFFGILIGDAGYGFVFLGLTVFAHRKLKGKFKEPTLFVLMYVLSTCAITWGFMTGTFFGTVLIGKTLKPLLVWLTEVKNLQFLCFLIGAIHLTIAHSWRLLMRIKTIFSALAELGWILIIWGAFFLANAMVIGIPLLGLDMNKAMVFVGIGAFLVIIDIFSRPKDGPAVGLVLTFFGCISAFTDVVSYIRLFAVGLAGVAVADAFNEMALGIGFNSVATGLITTLILVIGHLFNIILGTMAIFVHGLRLNVLEFSSHLGLEWSGVKYEPFKKVSV